MQGMVCPKLRSIVISLPYSFLLTGSIPLWKQLWCLLYDKNTQNHPTGEF